MFAIVIGIAVAIWVGRLEKNGHQRGVRLGFVLTLAFLWLTLWVGIGVVLLISGAPVIWFLSFSGFGLYSAYRLYYREFQSIHQEHVLRRMCRRADIDYDEYTQI